MEHAKLSILYKKRRGRQKKREDQQTTIIWLYRHFFTKLDTTISSFMHAKILSLQIWIDSFKRHKLTLFKFLAIICFKNCRKAELNIKNPPIYWQKPTYKIHTNSLRKLFKKEKNWLNNWWSLRKWNRRKRANFWHKNKFWSISQRNSKK